MNNRSSTDKNNYAELLNNLAPLNQISPRLIEKLAEDSRYITIAHGQRFIQRQNRSNECHYLIKGTVEIRTSPFDRYNYNPLEVKGLIRPLEDFIPDNATVTTVSDAKVIVLKRDAIVRYLDQSEKDAVALNDTSHLAALPTIDDNEDDWSGIFLQSPIATHLPATQLHKLMARLEDIEAKEGQQIIRQGDNGDYFYVLKEGEATLEAQDGSQLNLTMGQYFGEEALVSDGLRSATITAMTPCTLGRLDREDFLQILKSSLIQFADEQVLRRLGAQNRSCEIIDIRMSFECRQNAVPKSRNIPLNNLRKKLSKLDQTKAYLVSERGGCRSELATYLLRQSGFEAYLLKDDETLKSA